MQQRKNTLVFVILAGVAMIVIVLAIAFSGSSGTPFPMEETPIPDTTQEPPEVDGILTPEQQLSLDNLANSSAEPPTVLVRDGVVRFLTADVEIPDSLAIDARAKAEYFFETYSELIQIDNPLEQLVYDEETINSRGNSFIRFHQQYNGIPVYGSDLIISITENGHFDSLNAGYIPLLSIDTQPSTSVETAKEIAIADLNPDDAEVLDPVILVLYDPKVFDEPSNGPRLAWSLVAGSEIENDLQTYIIDAHSGEIIKKVSEIHEDREREVWDSQGHSYKRAILPKQSIQEMNENGPVSGASPDDDARNAWRHLETIYDYYWKTFRRDSYNSKGGKLVAHIHTTGINCRNAAWVNLFKRMFFCDNATEGQDVVAHELTHGVTSSTANLVYSNESGALNESYSDVFAAMMDSNFPWLITWDNEGNDIIRNIAQPEDGYPDHYTELVKPGEGLCTSDRERENGCVHINSSIPNFAAYLLTEGGDHSGISVDAISKLKVQQIYYEALAFRLAKNSNMAQARRITIEACESLVGHHGIVEEDCDQVENAFAAVGIGDPAKRPPQVTPPPITTSGSSTMLVFDSSGSMNEADQSGQSKLQAAKSAGQSIIEVIKAENLVVETGGTQLGMVDFNFNATIDAPLSTDVSAIEDGLQRLRADGGTGMPDGLKIGLDLFDQDTSDSKPILILLSDGMPNIGHGNDQNIDPGGVRQQVLSQAERAKEMGVCIYTVGFGVPGTIGSVSGDSSIDEELLRQIAKTSGCGTYYNAQNAIQLANVYVELRHVSTGEILLEQEGQISQDQRVDIGSLQVPGNQSILLYTLNWPGSSLDPILLDPLGKQVDEAYTGAAISTSPTIASIIVENPRSGQWQVAAYGMEVPSGITSYNAIISGRQSTAAPTTRFGPGVIIVLLALAGGGVVIYAITRKPKEIVTPSAESGLASLVAVSGPTVGTTTNLPNSGLLIGRGSDCSLCLTDRSVSRHHARIRFAQGKWYLQDQGSSGGTYVNGINITATALKDGDRIRIGQSEFVFRSMT